MNENGSLQKQLRAMLHPEDSFDLIERQVTLGGRAASFFLIDGFVKDDLFEKIAEFFYSLKPDDPSLQNESAFLSSSVPYCEVAPAASLQEAADAVLAGQTALAVNGFSQVLLLDLRTYPQRDTAEPEKDKVFRGSHDGFVETLVLNCALIRRRIRDSALRMESFTVGRASKTDVVLCYLSGRADSALLTALRQRLQRGGSVDALTMNAQSLSEMLLPRRWYNPFPRFRYTERPDTAAAQVLEGDVVLLVDNSPAVLSLPCTLFDVMEEANDFYFPPLIGSYLRLARFLVLLGMLLVTPFWLLAVQNPGALPSGLRFLLPAETPLVPIFWQLILLEIGIDGLKLATLNTPSMLTTSLSVIAGIVVGDFAVQSGWFSAESLLYMAFVALGGFNQPSYELIYATKFMRILLLCLTALLNLYGLLIGLAVVLTLLTRTKTFSGRGYLYPLIPLNLRALGRRLFCTTLPKE